jgi:hypothetical protein
VVNLEFVLSCLQGVVLMPKDNNEDTLYPEKTAKTNCNVIAQKFKINEFTYLVRVPIT